MAKRSKNNEPQIDFDKVFRSDEASDEHIEHRVRMRKTMSRSSTLAPGLDDLAERILSELYALKQVYRDDFVKVVTDHLEEFENLPTLADIDAVLVCLKHSLSKAFAAGENRHSGVPPVTRYVHLDAIYKACSSVNLLFQNAWKERHSPVLRVKRADKNDIISQ